VLLLASAAQFTLQFDFSMPRDNSEKRWGSPGEPKIVDV